MATTSRSITDIPIWPQCAKMLREGIPLIRVAAFIQEQGYQTETQLESVDRQLRRWLERQAKDENLPPVAVAEFEGIVARINELEELAKLIEDQKARVEKLKQQEEESGKINPRLGTEMTRQVNMLAKFATVKKTLRAAGLLSGETEDDEEEGWDDDDDEDLSDVATKRQLRAGLI